MKLQKNRKSSDHIHNTVYSIMNMILWSKQSFYSDTTSFLQWDRKFHMNAGWKSPHLAEPAKPSWASSPHMNSEQLTSYEVCVCAKKESKLWRYNAMLSPGDVNGHNEVIEWNVSFPLFTPFFIFF